MKSDLDNVYVREKGHLKAILIENSQDREIKKALNKAGIDITSMPHNYLNDKDMSREYNIHFMDKCDFVIIEASNDDSFNTYVGFLYAIGKPIYVIANKDSDFSSEITKMVNEIIFYDKYDDLVCSFLEITKKFPRIILASQSAVRKQQLIDASIPFEIIVSNADETPDKAKSFRNQLADISKRKAMKVFEETSNRGLRLIIAADQNIVFGGVMYGKPKTIKDARSLITKMMDSEEIYAYTGNCVLLADEDNILQSINVTDVSRMSMDNISTEELEKYLADKKCLTYCGGISISNSKFIHLKEGRMSTARGMTLEYALEMMKNFKYNN